MIQSHSVLITGGIGDFLTLDGFLTPKDRHQITAVWYATRCASDIRELVKVIWPHVRDHHVIERDYSTPIHAKGELRCVPGNVQDLSISVVFPGLRAGQGGCSAIWGPELSPTKKRRPVVVHPWTYADRRCPRSFSTLDWETVCVYLEVTGQEAAVVGVGGRVEVPNHPSLWNLVDVCPLLESVEIVKWCDTFIGIDSWPSVVAAQDTTKTLIVKSQGNHLAQFRHLYYAPRTDFTFISTDVLRAVLGCRIGHPPPATT